MYNSKSSTKAHYNLIQSQKHIIVDYLNGSLLGKMKKSIPHMPLP